MTPKQKAKELSDKMTKKMLSLSLHLSANRETAKECCLIAVDEILYALSVPPINNEGHMLFDSQIEYWNLVKSEIEKR